MGAQSTSKSPAIVKAPTMKIVQAQMIPTAEISAIKGQKLSASAMERLMTLKITFCVDMMMKYNGCHFKQIAEATTRAFLNRDLNTNKAFASKERTAAEMDKMAVGRKKLLLGLWDPSMHSER